MHRCVNSKKGGMLYVYPPLIIVVDNSHTELKLIGTIAEFHGYCTGSTDDTCFPHRSL